MYYGTPRASSRIENVKSRAFTRKKGGGRRENVQPRDVQRLDIRLVNKFKLNLY